MNTLFMYVIAGLLVVGSIGAGYAAIRISSLESTLVQKEEDLKKAVEAAESNFNALQEEKKTNTRIKDALQKERRKYSQTKAELDVILEGIHRASKEDDRPPTSITRRALEQLQRGSGNTPSGSPPN